MFQLQGEGDTHVGNAEDPAARALSLTATCDLVWFRLGAPEAGQVGFVDGELVARLDEEVALGPPSGAAAGFRADAAAAAAASLAFGLDPTAVSEGVRSVGPLPHRGEVVARAGSIAFIDDSKATNPHAALAALDGLWGAVLIAGGQSKGVDLSPLAAATSHLAGVVAMGEAASEIAGLFEERVPVRKAGSMEEAVGLAFELAPSTGTVILAPACASQDMFRDYSDRGERFAAAARELAGEADLRG